MVAARFCEARFPARISFGASGGPERRVEIVRLSTGFEHRNQRTAHAVRRYDAGSGVKSLANLAEIIAFFEARRGRLTGFRFRDPMDWHSARFGETPSPIDQQIGTGDGESRVFHLIKRYGAGEDAYLRPIAKPVAGSLRMALGAGEIASGFSLDPANGAVTFDSAPAVGAPITAGFAFDVPVRFDIDHLAISVAGFAAGEIPTIPLIEIRP